MQLLSLQLEASCLEWVERQKLCGRKQCCLQKSKIQKFKKCPIIKISKNTKINKKNIFQKIDLVYAKHHLVYTKHRLVYADKKRPPKRKKSVHETPLSVHELSAPVRLRVQSRSRKRLRIAASIAFLFRTCKGVFDTIAPLSRG